jgi:uncharacterized cupredoxin-like copper-binding protein
MTPLRIALIAALAVAAAAPAGSKPAMPTVNITLASHYYHPNPIYLAGGVPVRLIFTNRSGSTHEFDAPIFFRSARILAGSAPNGEVEVKKGRSVIVDLIPARGTYKVHCGRPFHTMLGMTTRVIVG